MARFLGFDGPPTLPPMVQWKMGVPSILVSFHLGDPFSTEPWLWEKGCSPLHFYGGDCFGVAFSMNCYTCLHIPGIRRISWFIVAPSKSNKPRSTNTSSFESRIAARLLWYPPEKESMIFLPKSRHFWGSRWFSELPKVGYVIVSWRVNFY